MGQVPNANTLGTTRGHAPPVLSATRTQATAQTGEVVAAVAGKQIAVVGFDVSGGNATGGLVKLVDGSGGTEKWRGFIATTSAVARNAPAGGFVFRGSSNTALVIDNASGGNVYCNVTYVLETA